MFPYTHLKKQEMLILYFDRANQMDISCRFVAETGEGVANSLVSALKNIHDR